MSAALLYAPGVFAQAGPVPGLTLETAVGEALRSRTAIAVARWNVRASEGLLAQARGAFDPELHLTAWTQREPVAIEEGPPSTRPSAGLHYQLDMEQRFRWGGRFIPSVTYSRTGIGEAGGVPRNVASARLDFTLPFLRGRNGGAAVEAERSAELVFEADRATLRHSRSQVVLGVVLAYWTYAAATERLAVLRQAEERARQLVEDTRALVASDERPAADMASVRGNYALKRSARVAAEQALLAAREALGLEMGIEADALHSLPPAATSLPTAASARAARFPSADDLEERSLGSRADLLAAHRRSQAADATVQGLLDDTRATLDLTLGIGYTGFEDGAALDRLITPFYSERGGPRFTLEVAYAIPVRNRAAQGRVRQAEAFARTTDLEAADLARSIAIRVATAAEVVGRSAEELEFAAQAVSLYTSVVENEKQRFRLGAATLFDLLFAEDGLTSALLAETDGRLRYAEAVARMHYEAGILLAPDGMGVNLEVLTREEGA